MVQVMVAVLLLLAISGALGNTECPQHCQTCVQNKPTECQDKRGLIPRPDCISCCVVCAKILGESCDEKENPCSNDLQCKNGKCEELPEALRPSTPPIELLSAMAINSSTARLVVRLPPIATSEVAVTMALQSTGPWTRVPHITNMTKEDGSLELIVSGLEGTVHLFRVEHQELRSRAVRVELPVQDTTEAAKSCDYQGHEFQVGEAYLSTDCMERCECRSEGKFSCSETSPEASEACRGAARKLNIIQIIDSNEDSVSLKWSGPAGVVLQSRAIGTSGTWQRAERLTPDGTESPANLTLSSLQPFTTYEIRAVLPGAEDGRSSRGEDSPPMASATTKPGPGQGDSGFCVVLGRKIATGEEIPTPNGSCSDQKCMCMPGQPPICKPRCAVPFFKRGAFSDDPLCEEKPSPDDSCCVLLTCADNSLVTEEGGSDPCEQCGANAECHKSMVTSMADEALCMCKDGYIGDPYDRKEGCKLTAVHAVSSKTGEMDKMDRCFFKNMTYSPGDHFTDGCEHLCSCTVQVEIMCKPRCTPVPDSMGPGCKLVTDSKDECCRVVMCETEKEKSKTEAGVPLAAGELFDGCKYKNKTYQRDEKFEDGCEKLCTCNTSGDVFCKPRCAPPPSNTSDKCVTLRDPHDSCCTVVLCDVTLADQEVMKVSASNLESESNNMTKTTTPSTIMTPSITIEMAEAVNASAARLVAKLPQGDDWPKGAPEVAVFVAHAKDGPWTKAPGLAISQTDKALLQLTVAGLEPGPTHLRIEHGDMRSDVVEVKLPEAPLGTTCEYKGKHYTRGDEFHDGCEMYCACTKTGVQCATIECPTDFGLDVLDPHCLDWEAEPGFVATPPRCCPDMRCRDNGSCTYRGSRFDNFAEIPTKLSGCEQRCYCEFGNVSCNPACPPVPATPPSTLQCPPSEARLAHLPGEECCRYWLCPQPQLPPAPAGISSNTSLPPHLHPQANMTLDATTTPNTLSPSPDMTKITTHNPDFTTTEFVTERFLPPNFIPTAIPDFDEKLHKVAEELLPEVYKNKTENLDKTEKNTDFVKEKTEKTKIQNKGNEFQGPFALNPDKEHKNKDKFQGPYAPYFQQNETSRVPISPGGRPGPVILDGHDEEHLGPFSIPARPPPQSPPGPFLIRGEPIPGPISENGQPPIIIAHTPDGRPIIQQRPNPNLNPIRGGGHQHPGNNFHPYHEGQVPPFVQQGPPRPSGNRPPQSNRPPYGALSPIAAQIEEHLQRHPGATGFHPDEDEVYHIRPHQGRPPPDAEVYHLPSEGEHFVLQDGTVVRIAPPPQHGRQPEGARRPPIGPPQRQPEGSRHPPIGPPQRQPQFAEQRPIGRPHHVLHDESPHPPQGRPFLPPHLADLTPEQLLGVVRSNHSTMTKPHDPDAVSSHSLEHTASSGPGFPTRPFATAPFPPHSGNDLQLKTPQLLGPREVRLGFAVPPIYVGLHGRVEIRYTDDPTKEDPSTWQRASSTSDEIIESPQLVHEVSGLKPNTEYRIQVAMRLRDVDNELSSHVVSFRTPPEESLVSSTTLPPQIPIDAGLAVADVNSTWMRVRWRKFNEYELQFIDGVQLRYKERDGKVYAATPLLYRLVDNYMLEDLRPGTEYEVGIFFIPFPGQTTELQAERSVQATTAPEQADPYGFDLALTVAMVKANSVELSWTGVPYPEDKYVNIYRAIYQSDLEVGKQELSSTFKLAKRDAPARTVVQDLKPNTRYRIWLEAYLTNGKIKKSDVRTFTTKPGALASAGASEQVANDAPRGDYYGALVGVAIVAALAVVGLAILLMILVRRQSAASAAITPRPAKAEAAYDNPTYKTSDDLTPVNGSTNGSSKHHTPVHEEA